MAEGFTNSLNNYGKLSLTNNQIRQGEFINTSRSFHQNIKEFLKNLFIFLKKLFQVFKQLFWLFFRLSVEKRILGRSAYRNGKHLSASFQEIQALGC